MIRICNRAIDEMTDVLGKGIANICYVVNPEVVRTWRRNHGAGSIPEGQD